MAFICDKLSDNWQKDIDPNKVWSHLETMYNLEALDESESLPFPNLESEFLLPEIDFGSLVVKKDEEKKVQPQKGRETPKIVKETQKREEKANNRNSQRRDSKDSKEKKPESSKKEVKKDTEKGKPNAKGRNSISGGNTISTATKEEKKAETPKPVKRPTRGSLKPNDDSGSSGKSSPVTVTPSSAKRRRI